MGTSSGDATTMMFVHSLSSHLTISQSRVWVMSWLSGSVKVAVRTSPTGGVSADRVM